MACERNRIIKLTEFLASRNIAVNIGKTKARGHKGFFMHKSDSYRIDIAKNLPEENIVSVLLHELAHFVHYNYDKSLKSLEFAFGEESDRIKEELINVTVKEIPKDFAASLFDAKKKLSEDIKELANVIKSEIPDFKISEKNKKIEKSLNVVQKYLLSYDRIKILNKMYSVEQLDELDLKVYQAAYIKIKSIQRKIKRINSKISRLNRYYNNPSELFARFIELYYTDKKSAYELAPAACKKFEHSCANDFKEIEKILSL